MIQANELRIGNWINIQSHNQYAQIIEIKSGRPDNRDFVRISSPNLDTQFAVEISQINPIPLTEDILLKAGGKRFDEDKIILMLNDPSTHLVLMKVGTHWFPQIEQTGEFASERVNVVFLNFIDYVHQLQNLFFVLAGKEIKNEL